MRVRLVGLLPAILKPCGPACAQPFMNRPVKSLTEEELREAPPFVRENGERAHAIAEQLFRDFGQDVRIEVLGLDSPRGILFAARHRIGGGFAVAVDGKPVLREPRDYNAVKTAVADALRERAISTP